MTHFLFLVTCQWAPTAAVPWETTEIQTRSKRRLLQSFASNYFENYLSNDASSPSCPRRRALTVVERWVPVLSFECLLKREQPKRPPRRARPLTCEAHPRSNRGGRRCRTWWGGCILLLKFELGACHSRRQVSFSKARNLWWHFGGIYFGLKILRIRQHLFFLTCFDLKFTNNRFRSQMYFIWGATVLDDHVTRKVKVNGDSSTMIVIFISGQPENRHTCSPMIYALPNQTGSRLFCNKLIG